MKLPIVASVLGFVLVVGGVALIYWKAGVITAGVLLMTFGLFTEVTDAPDR